MQFETKRIVLFLFSKIQDDLKTFFEFLEAGA